jgi:hypothetical protein
MMMMRWETSTPYAMRLELHEIEIFLGFQKMTILKSHPSINQSPTTMSDNSIKLVASTVKQIRETWFGSDDDVSLYLADMAVKIEEIAPDAAEAVARMHQEPSMSPMYDRVKSRAAYVATSPLASYTFEWLRLILGVAVTRHQKLGQKSMAMASAACAASRAAARSVAAAIAVRDAMEALRAANRAVASTASSRDARNAKRVAERAEQALVQAVNDAVEAAREAAETAADAEEASGSVSTLVEQSKNVIQPGMAVATMYSHIYEQVKFALSKFA